MFNKALIADRIDRLIREVGDQDKLVNAQVGNGIGVSGEAIRAWRKGVNLPRLEHLDDLCKFLVDKGIKAVPEYVLFGHQAKDSQVHLRERIADDGPELEILRLYRAASPHGKQLILEMARAYQLAHPQPSHVVSIHQKRQRRRK